MPSQNPTATPAWIPPAGKAWPKRSACLAGLLLQVIPFLRMLMLVLVLLGRLGFLAAVLVKPRQEAITILLDITISIVIKIVIIAFALTCLNAFLCLRAALNQNCSAPRKASENLRTALSGAVRFFERSKNVSPFRTAQRPDADCLAHRQVATAENSFKALQAFAA